MNSLNVSAYFDSPMPLFPDNHIVKTWSPSALCFKSWLRLPWWCSWPLKAKTCVMEISNYSLKPSVQTNSTLAIPFFRLRDRRSSPVLLVYFSLFNKTNSLSKLKLAASHLVKTFVPSHFLCSTPSTQLCPTYVCAVPNCCHPVSKITMNTKSKQ